MNKVFRLIWNRTLGLMVVASEAARSKDKAGNSSGQVGEAPTLTPPKTQAFAKFSPLAALVAVIGLIVSQGVGATAFSQFTANATGSTSFSMSNGAPIGGDSSVNNCFTTDAANDLWSCLGQTSEGGIFFLSGIDDPDANRFENAPSQGAIAIGNANTIAAGRNAIAVGANASTGAETTGGVSIGHNANISGPTTRGMAIGEWATISTSGQRADGSDFIAVDVFAIGTGARVETTDRPVHSSFAVGTDASVVNAKQAQAIGYDSSVERGVASLSVGYKSSIVDADFSQALGPQSSVKDSRAAISAGVNAVVSNSDNGQAIGPFATVENSLSGQAFGRRAQVSDSTSGIAIGEDSTVTNAPRGIAIGKASKVESDYSIAIGQNTQASNTHAIAMGKNATASGRESISIGYGNTVSGDGAGAFGDPNNISGDGSYATGNDNVINAENAGAFGNDNALNVTATGSRIIGNGVTMDAADAFVMGNGASVTQDGGVAIGSGSAATVASGVAGYAPTGADRAAIDATTSTRSAVDVGSRQITSVAAGAADDDAVNVAQLKTVADATRTEVLAGTNADVVQSTGSGGQTQYTVDADVASVSAASADIEVIAGAKDPATNITDYAVDLSQSVKDDITNANKGWDLQTNGDTATNVAPGDTVQFLDGNNIDVTRTGKDITVATSPDLTADSLTINNGGPVINDAGIDMGDNKVTNLADGEVSNTSTDAVNGSQLFATNENVTNNTTNITNNTDAIDKGINFGDGATANNYALGDTLNVKGDANVTSTTTADGVQLALADVVNIGSTNPVTIDGDAGTIGGLTNKTFDPNNFTSGQAASEDQLKQVSDVANAGWDVQTNGDTATNVASGNTVQFLDGNNIDITRTGKDITVATSPDLTADSLTINNGGPVINDAGIDMGDKKITNVAPGTDGTDAVNVDQLTKVETDLTTNGLDFAGNEGADVHRDLGQTLAIQGEATSGGTYTGANLKTVTDPATGAINLQMTDSPDFTNVNVTNQLDVAGDTYLGDDFSVVNNEAIYNVEPDEITGNYQVVNKKYVTQAGDDLIENNPLTFMGDRGTQFDRKLSETTYVKGNSTGTLIGGNIGVVADGEDTLSIQLAENIDLGENGTVVMGDTTVKNDGLTITGGPSITNTGIDAGNTNITNVAPGEAGTDAVNVDQLTSVENIANEGWNLTANSEVSGENIGPSETANFTQDQNIDITRNGNSIVVATVDDVEFTNVTTDNLQVNENLTVDGDVYLGDSFEIVNNEAFYNNEEVATLGDGLNFAGNTGDEIGKTLSETLTVSGELDGAEAASGSNLRVDSEDGQLNLVMSKNLMDLESVTVGDTFIDDSSIKTNNVTINEDLNVVGNTVLGDTNIANTLDVTDGAISVAENTTVNMGDNQITNVAAGTEGDHAVNLNQLTEVNNLASEGWYLSANGEDTDGFNVAPGEAADFTEGQNIAISRDEGIITVATADDVEFTNVATENLQVNETLTVEGDTFLNKDLTVSGDTTINENLLVEGTTQLGDNFYVTEEGNVTYNGDITEDNHITNKSYVDNSVTELGGTPLTFIGNSGETDRKLGEELNIIGSNDNITTEVTADDRLEIAMSDDLNLDSLTINNGGPVINESGLTVGDTIVNGDSIKTSNVTINEDLNVAGNTVLGDTNIANTLDVTDGAISVTENTTVNMGGNQITNVAAGTEGDHAVNLDQLTTVNELASEGWYLSANGEDTDGFNVAPGEAADFTEGQNIVISRDEGTITVATADNVEFSTVEVSESINVAGDTTINEGGIETSNVTVNENLTVVGDTVINENLTVEGSTQLGDNFYVTEEGNVTYDGDITEGNHITNKDYVDNSVTELSDTPLTFAGDEGEFDRKLGETTNVVGGADTEALTEGNIGVIAEDGTLNIQLAENVDLGENGSVVMGDTTINNDGLAVGDTIVNGDSITTNNVTVNEDLNIAGNTVMEGDLTVERVTQLGDNFTVNDNGNVTYDGDITEGNHIVNKDYVDGGIGELADTPLNFAGNTGETISKKLGEALTISGELAEDEAATGANLRVDSDGEQLNLVMTKNLTDLESITLGDTFINNEGVSVGDTVLNDDGLTISNGPSVTIDGIDAGDTTITNVAPGENGTDAVNKDQLDNVEAVASAGWNVQTTDDANAPALSNVAPSKDVDFVSSDGNVAITHTQDANGDTDVDYRLSDDIKLGGDLTVDNGVTQLGDTFIVEGDKVTYEIAPDEIIEGSQVVNKDYIDQIVSGGDFETRYVNTNDDGLTESDSFANGTGSTAVGYEATSDGDQSLALGYMSQAEGDDSVALGSNAQVGTAETANLASDVREAGNAHFIDLGSDDSAKRYDFAGVDPVSTVSVGSAGNERTITNVAAGRITADSTDAINGSQLYALSDHLNQLGDRISTIEDDDRSPTVVGPAPETDLSGVVKYDREDDNVDYSQVTLEGEDGTTVTNVADGEVSDDSSDAINGSQLYDTNRNVANNTANIENNSDRITNNEGDIADNRQRISTNENSIGDINETLDKGLNFGADEGDVVNRQLGDTVAITGDGNITTRTTDNGVQVTLDRNLDVDRVTTGGTTVSDNGVTIEGGPSMTQNGFDANGTTITNVAPGVNEGDAVNVGQMNALSQRFVQEIGDVHNRIDDVARDASAGIASVAAMGNAPYVPGKLTYHVGGGHHNGESAVGINFRRTADNGRWSLTAGIAGSRAGATIGLGVSGVID